MEKYTTGDFATRPAGGDFAFTAFRKSRSAAVRSRRSFPLSSSSAALREANARTRANGLRRNSDRRVAEMRSARKSQSSLHSLLDVHHKLRARISSRSRVVAPGFDPFVDRPFFFGMEPGSTLRLERFCIHRSLFGIRVRNSTSGSLFYFQVALESTLRSRTCSRSRFFLLFLPLNEGYEQPRLRSR